MKSRKQGLAVVLLACAGVAVLALSAATGSAKTHKQAKVFKVAWIYVGPHNDAGWSEAHDKGRLYVQKKLGSKVQTTYKEKVALGPQLQQTVASLVREGYQMIFGTSYGYFDTKLAAKYPNVKFAESKKIPWVGYDSNAKRYAPHSWLTASVYNWGPYYLRRVKAAMNGTWKSGFYYGNMNDGFTKLAPYGPKVTKKTKIAIAKKMKAIENGSLYEFKGPLYDQHGKLRVKKGQRMQVLKGGTNSLYGMNWLVRGVIGSPKGH